MLFVDDIVLVQKKTGAVKTSLEEKALKVSFNKQGRFWRYQGKKK